MKITKGSCSNPSPSPHCWTHVAVITSWLSAVSLIGLCVTSGHAVLKKRTMGEVTTPFIFTHQHVINLQEQIKRGEAKLCICTDGETHFLVFSPVSLVLVLVVVLVVVLVRRRGGMRRRGECGGNAITESQRTMSVCGVCGVDPPPGLTLCGFSCKSTPSSFGLQWPGA